MIETEEPRATAHAPRWGIIGAATGLLVALLVTSVSSRAENTDASPAADGPGDGGAPGSGGAPAPPTANVRIVFKIIPNGNATVMWGKKRLGVIKPRASLIVQRPRDSGPLDVVFRSPGYIPVHSRAYTFTDSTVAVKMTPLDKKNTLYGYREEIPPEADAGAPGADPDGGVP